MSTPPRCIGRGEGHRHALGQRDGGGLVDVLADDDELVAAEAGDEVARAHGRAQPARDLDEQLVAGRVAEGVVDDLEVVQVEEEAGQAAGARPEPLGHVLGEQRAVGQPGQRVVVGLVGELGLEGQPVGDVLDRADEAGAHARGEQVREADDRRPDVAAVKDEPRRRLGVAALEGVGDLLDHAVEVVGVDGVDPTGAEQLLGAQPDQRAERVVDVRQPHALLGEQRRHRGPLGQRGEPALVGVGGGPQRAFLLVGRRDHAQRPHPATRRRGGHDQRVHVRAAGGADGHRHADGALAAHEELELPAAEAGEQVVERQRPQVVQAVAEQLDGALVAPGQPRDAAVDLGDQDRHRVADRGAVEDGGDDLGRHEVVVHRTDGDGHSPPPPARSTSPVGCATDYFGRSAGCPSPGRARDPSVGGSRPFQAVTGRLPGRSRSGRAPSPPSAAVAGEDLLQRRVLRMIPMPARVNVASVNTCGASSGLVSAWVNASLATMAVSSSPIIWSVGVVLGEDPDVPLELVDVAVQRLQPLAARAASAVSSAKLVIGGSPYASR